MTEKTIYIGARVKPELKELIEKVSKARGMNVCDFIRYLILRELAELGFLPDYYKKAFGLLKGAEKVEA